MTEPAATYDANGKPIVAESVAEFAIHPTQAIVHWQAIERIAQQIVAAYRRSDRKALEIGLARLDREMPREK